MKQHSRSTFAAAATLVATLVMSFIVSAAPAHARAEIIDDVPVAELADPTGGSDVEPQETSLVESDFSETQWYRSVLGAVSLARQGVNGDGVTVAVLADGVDDQHPDLIGQVLPGYDATTRLGTPVGSSHGFYDAGATGTFQAVMIAGDADGRGLTGIAPGAKILPVVVDGSKHSLRDLDVAAGIDWAVANGAHLITLALGVAEGITDEKVSATCAAITRARTAKVLTFVPAQNDEVMSETQFLPATCTDAIVVTAVGENLTNQSRRPIAGTPRFAAPGFSISSGTQGDHWLPYTTAVSSNWAAASAAGAAALVLDGSPSADLVALLSTTATDLGTPGVDQAYGHGLIDAAAAVRGGAPVSLQERLSASATISVPTIVSASRDGNGNTSLSWEPPFGSTVKSYDVVSHRFVDGRWVLETFSFGALDVRGIIPVDVHLDTYVTVVAHTPAGPRMSAPISSSDYDPAEPLHARDAEEAAVTSVTSSWVAGGIRVDVVTNDVTRPWDIVVIDLASGEVVKKVTVPGTSSTRVITYGEYDKARTTSLLVGAGVGRNGIDTYLLPQYGVAGNVVAAGKSRAGISGSVTCLDDERIHCGERTIPVGTVLTVRDAKTRKVLTTARVRSDHGFFAVWSHPASKFDVIIEAPNGERSMQLEGSFWYR